MAKIFTINYVGSHSTGIAYEEDVKMFLQDEDAYLGEQIKECQRCGKQTEEIEVVGMLTGCKECEEKYHAKQRRAREYMYGYNENEEYVY